MRHLLAFLIAVAALLVAPAGWAEDTPDNIQIGFSVEPGSAPSYVCVQYTDGSVCPDGAMDLDVQRPAFSTHADGDGNWLFDAPPAGDSPPAGKASVPGAAGRTCKAPDPTEALAMQGQEKQNRSALQSLGAPATECGERSRSCAPRMSVRSRSMRMRCASNGTPGDRVAVVALSFPPASVGRVMRIEYTGLSAVLWYELKAAGATKSRTFVANVAGGHYMPTTEAPTSQGRVVLPLQVRCPAYDVPLPAVVGANPQVRIDVCTDEATIEQVNGAPVKVPNGSRCIRPWSSSVRIHLPSVGRGRQKWIATDLLTSRPTAGGAASHRDSDLTCNPRQAPTPGADAGTSFWAPWLDAVPPQPLALTPTRLAFSWRADRDYPLQTGTPVCPHTRLVEPAADCGPGLPSLEPGGLRCDYSCPAAGRAENVTPVVLPVTVAFTVSELSDEWRESLTRAGDVLSGHPDGDHRHFIVDMTGWNLSAIKDTIGDRLSWMDLVSPSGQVNRLALTDQQVIQLPGVTSGNVLLYEIHGSRDYSEDHAVICHGRVVPAPPGHTARQWSLGVALGAGDGFPFVPFGSGPPLHESVSPHAAGVAQVAVRYKKRPLPDNNLLEKLAWEWQFTYVFGSMSYLPLRVPGDVSSQAADTVAYSRFDLGLFVPVVAPLDTVELGVAPLAIGWEEPFSGADHVRVGGATPYYGPYGFVRFALGHAFAVEVAARAALLETVYGYASTTFRGTPDRVGYESATVFLDGTLRWWLF